MTNEQLMKGIELHEKFIDAREHAERADRCVTHLREGKGFSWFEGDLSEQESSVIAEAVQHIAFLRWTRLVAIENDIAELWPPG